MPEPEDEERIHAAIARVWESSRAIVLERVTVIEQAAAALATGTIAPEQLEDARRAAHNLAGTLGTFGLDRGSALAHDLELRFGGTSSQLDADDLVRLATELRATVNSA